jgi:transcription elongation GreA/GreB family factor
MSKAFTKETETDEDDPESVSALPPGSKNYMTLTGYGRLRSELDQLVRDERPRIVETVAWAASNGDRSENGDYIYGKKRLREIDRRIRFLIKRLESATVVDPQDQQNTDQVFFGATVSYKMTTAANTRCRSSVSTRPMPPKVASRGYRPWRAHCSRRVKATPCACRVRPGCARSRSSTSGTVDRAYSCGIHLRYVIASPIFQAKGLTMNRTSKAPWPPSCSP